MWHMLLIGFFNIPWRVRATQEARLAVESVGKECGSALFLTSFLRTDGCRLGRELAPRGRGVSVGDHEVVEAAGAVRRAFFLVTEMRVVRDLVDCDRSDRS